MEECTLHEALITQARESPGQLAIGFRGTRLTYAELLVAARNIATTLHDAGVSPGDRVALALPKGLEAVASVYAASLLGAAYVPLELRWPETRLHDVVKVARPAVLLCRPQEQAWLNQEVGAICHTMVPVIEVRESWLRESSSPVLSDPSLPAYVLFTSGSTGEPKGVVHTQSSVMNFARWAAQHLHLRPGDRLSGHAHLSFDLSTFDLFAALHAGASVWPIPESVMFRSALLRRFIQEHRLTIWYSVPRLWDLMTEDTLPAAPLTSLRHVVWAGERISTSMLPSCRELAPRAAFHNWFGPTETNVCCAYTLCDGDFKAGEEIPIGCTAAGAELRITPSPSRPIGGNLEVKGPSVMQGYLREPKCAAWYDTGDIVRLNDSGDLVFLGRSDTQLKVRGHRIEAAEIEQIAESTDGVKEAVALMLGDRLVLCVCPDSGGAKPDLPASLRHALRERLPSACQPDTLEFIPKIPRDMRGKRDLGRLEAFLTET